MMDNIQIIRRIYNTLKPVQKDMYIAFAKSTNRKTIIHSSRRLGKTYLLCVISIIHAINKPLSQIRYVGTTQKAVRKMIQPIMKQILLLMPAGDRPKWSSLDARYQFSNGSQLHILGTNNGHADDARGTAADLCLIDEASFVDDLRYLTESVLMPQLLTVENSRLIMASSSPLSPAHEFTQYIQTSILENAYHNYTIYDGGYSPEIIAEFCKESGGASTTVWRREYLNELIVDDEMSIIPEYKDEMVKEVSPDRYNKFYHRYEAMDLGVRDKTVCLFGYYDFKRAKLIIEDEFDISGADTTTLAISNLIKKHRKHLPYRAIADNNNPLLINDLSLLHNVEYYATNKETLPAMINDVRLLVGANRLEINPKCKQLIGCLKYGVYQDTKRKEFGRSSAYGHYDALAALVYLVRNLDSSTNPIPRDLDYTENTFDPNRYQDNVLNQIFNIKES